MAKKTSKPIDYEELEIAVDVTTPASAGARQQSATGTNQDSTLRQSQQYLARNSVENLRSSIQVNRTSVEIPSAYQDVAQRVSLQLEEKVRKAKETPAEKQAADITKSLDFDDHKLSVEELTKRYKVDLEKGLDATARAKLLEKWGKNVLTPPPSTPEWIKFMITLFSPFAILLWIAGVLAFMTYFLADEEQKSVDNIYIGVVLFTVNIITGTFSYFQESKSSKVMEGFKKLIPQTAEIKIGGKTKTIDASTLVPGDVISVKSGDKIPADVRLTASFGLTVDNSSLTGEAEPQKRVHEPCDTLSIEANNVAFFGTMALEGTAQGIVIKTGDHTMLGNIAHLASATEQAETPIAKEIRRFINVVAGLAIVIAGVFFIIGLMQEGSDFMTQLLFAMSILVACVPEGLLTTITVCLSLTAQRMAQRNVLVRKLESVETLGSTTIICSDKTGTLTQNKMTLCHYWQPGCENVREVRASYKEGTFTGDYSFDEVDFTALHRTLSLCSRSVFVEEEPQVDEEGNTIELMEEKPPLSRHVNGDASETAILKFAATIGDVDGLRASWIKLADVPFNSRVKYSASVHAVPASYKNEIDLDEHADAAEITARSPHFHLKGAPERILDRCTYALIGGKVVPMTEEIRESFNKVYNELGSMGERVLGFAYRYLPNEYASEDFDWSSIDVTSETEFPYFEKLIFTGLVSLVDPPREDVPFAVETCRSAGVRVFMVTGDHPVTAEAIAKQIGLITHKTASEIIKEKDIEGEYIELLTKHRKYQFKSAVISGAQLREISEEQLAEIVRIPEIVFARTAPQQKLRIIEACQSIGEIAAATGDGVNDAPAIRAADIGVAMKSGSDVTQEAADMVLMDDSFSSIVNGVEEGRLIFSNISKSIFYTLSSNIPEIVPFLFFITTGLVQVLTAVLILCIDVGTDLWPAMSFAFEGPESDLMNKPPRGRNEHLINARLIFVSYGIIGMIQTVAGFITFFWTVCRDPDTDFTVKGFFKHGHEWSMIKENMDVIERGRSAYFYSIIIVQIGDAILSKTRNISIFQHNMKNRVMNTGFIFELCLGLVLVSVPFLNTVLGTQPISFMDVIWAIPFSVLLVAVDELRKLAIRRNPNGFVYRCTYY